MKSESGHEEGQRSQVSFLPPARRPGKIAGSSDLRPLNKTYVQVISHKDRDLMQEMHEYIRKEY